MNHLLSTRRTAVALAASFGLTGLATAQDCKISMRAAADVVTSGQTLAVDAYALFPATAHALASASFDVLATHPAWSSSSNGAIVGNDVLGIVSAQAHNPPLGVIADPANPMRLWHGQHAPVSDVPAVVQYQAQPGALSVYPSALTSSSAPCDTAGGSDLVLVNPLKAGRVRAAPGEGTQVRLRPVVDDVVVDGNIITSPVPMPLVFGLLLPTVQKSEPPCFGLDPKTSPSSLSIGVRTQRSAQAPNEPVTLNFTKVTWEHKSAGIAVTDASETTTRGTFRAYLGGIEVARGTLDRAGEPTADTSALQMAALPSHVSTRAEPKRGPRGASLTMGVSIVYALGFDAPVHALVRNPQGESAAVSVDRVELDMSAGTAPRAAARRVQPGIHTFEAAGVDAWGVVVRGADRPEVCRR